MHDFSKVLTPKVKKKKQGNNKSNKWIKLEVCPSRLTMILISQHVQRQIRSRAAQY